MFLGRLQTEACNYNGSGLNSGMSGIVKTQWSELWGMGRVLGFGVLECWMYGCRGQRHGLNLCVLPSLPELECLCISEGRSEDKGLG